MANTTPANAPTQPSLIVAMHRQWEAAYAAHEVNDEKAIRSRDDTQRDAHNRAMMACYREQTHLRMAILHQVPRSQIDAAILQFHIQGLTEAMVSKDCDDGELKAMALAIETVFEWMASAIDDPIGEQFENADEFIRNARADRTAKPSAKEA
jgi:hypothetical protein